MVRKRGIGEELAAMYDTLFEGFGPQGWWPGRTRFEVIVGAILTQNTAWTNVEKAIAGLKRKKLLNLSAMNSADVSVLAEVIRPAGYFNIKARRLKNFTAYLADNYGANLDRFFRKPDAELREELLGINGIGPETADSILLYAAKRPQFVVDAYTMRVFERHGLLSAGAGYDHVKGLFMENLAPDVGLFNEYHALIVRVGKDFCRPRSPRCEACPLGEFL